ncbi:MAG: response regulator, partial [Chloroflexi bacterium]|nr:response regulator [Chloroflexota bacterium]
MEGLRILVVEDQAIVARDIQSTLKALGYDVPVVAHTGEDAIRKAAETSPDLVLMDINLRDKMDGIEAAGHIRQRADIPVIFLTAYSDEATLQRAKTTGPMAYLIKPFEESELRTAIEVALWRHGMEKRLRESEQRFRMIFENANDEIVLLDENGIVIDVNDRVLDIFGYSRQEVVGRNIFDIPFLDTKAMEQATTEFSNALCTGVAHLMSFEARHRDGHAVHVEASTNLILQDGRVEGILVIIRDITERKQAEAKIQEQHEEIRVHAYQLEAANDELRNTQEQLIEINEQLRASEEKYRTLVNSAGTPITYYDLKGRIVLINKAAARVLGGTVDELTGKTVYEIIPGCAESTMQRMRRVVELGTGDEFEESLELPWGKFWFVTNMQPVSDASGNICGVQIISQDITERKQMEERIFEYSEELERRFEELQAMYRKLQELDKMKDNFLSTVSHELRTPLTSIKSFAEILLSYDEDVATQKEFLKIINDETNRLTRLINDVLDIAKIESGRIQWEIVKLDVSQIIGSAISATQGLFAQADLTVDVSCEPDLPTVWGDEDRIAQVITNLISNAIKFTPVGGKVWVEAEHLKEEGKGDHADMVKVSITDTGIGIPPEEHKRIFEKFHQVGNTLEGKPKGTGLGLPICKEIVEYFGGTIWVESEPLKGSTFSFTLPIASGELIERKAMPREKEAAEPVRKETVHSNKPRGRKILIVDDEANIRRFLNHELTQEGHIVIEAENGHDAIRMAREHMPDLITLDVLMPDITGLDVTAVLKSDPDTRDIPVVVISVMEWQDRAFKLGAADYITKPCNTSEMVRKIDRLLERSQGRILIVDNDRALTRSISYELEKRGYTTFVAHDGQEGLAAARKSHPDLVILDMIMPAMDGYEFINTLKNDPVTADLPIIALTGLEADGARVKALSLGATGYVVKSGG